MRSEENTLKCSVLNKLHCFVVRDDQEPIFQVFRPTTEKIRDNQEPSLLVYTPTREKVRVDHNVTFLVVGHGKFPVTFVVT